MLCFAQTYVPSCKTNMNLHAVKVCYSFQMFLEPEFVFNINIIYFSISRGNLESVDY